jgi:hypothetical protein
MKNTTKKLTIAAAFLAVATAVASAETLKADIPFAFRAGDSVMSPGAYSVKVDPANHLVTLSSYDTRQTAMLIPSGIGDAAKAWRAKGEPVLAFECGIGKCTITQVWTGSAHPAYSLPHRGGEHAPLTLIRLVRTGN